MTRHKRHEDEKQPTFILGYDINDIDQNAGYYIALGAIVLLSLAVLAFKLTSVI